jgi:hypothetical protein
MTWVIMALIVASLAYRENTAQRFEGGWASTDQGHIEFHELRFGWPYAHVVHYVFGSASITSGWHWGWFGVNVLFCLVLTLSTAAVVETRLRGSRPLQFNTRLLLVFIAITGVLMGLATQHDGWFVLLDFLGGVPTELVSWEGFSNPILWPMQFALGCTIFCLGWLGLAFAHRAYRLVRP